MNKNYEEIQKEIDKLLYEPSRVQTHKKYKDMKKDKKYYEKMKKIAQLMLKLEEENKKHHNS
jgi:L-fucose isomerase-like protein